MNKFILISLDRPDRQATPDEVKAMMSLYDAQPVIGCYKGQVETSFKVDFKWLNSMLALAHKYNQETILVDDGSIYLIDIKTLDKIELGKHWRMSNVKPDVDAYTIIDNVYYYL